MTQKSYIVDVVFTNSAVGSVIVIAENMDAAIVAAKEYDFVTSAYAARVYL